MDGVSAQLGAAATGGTTALVARPGLLWLALAPASFVIVFLVALAWPKPLGPSEQALIERAGARVRW